MRTSLRSSKGWRKHQKEDDDDGGSDSGDEGAKRLVDSADEFDDFFDRTKNQQMLPTATASRGLG